MHNDENMDLYKGGLGQRPSKHDDTGPLPKCTVLVP